MSLDRLRELGQCSSLSMNFVEEVVYLHLTNWRFVGLHLTCWRTHISPLLDSEPSLFKSRTPGKLGQSDLHLFAAVWRAIYKSTAFGTLQAKYCV